MSDPHQFKNDDCGYLSWLEANPAGFVLNVDTAGPGSHRTHSARCRYLYPPRLDRRHTTYRKAVSRDLETLETWGNRNGVATRCSCLKLV